ncbi:60S ribosomal subunit assembly/export protein loc-1 [Sarocladium implicatum]|nr:60S ribosomal subunit assembly/export protein loc-1 [Sarocladium implicatum]
MAPTRTVKNKHAGPKTSSKGGDKRSASDGVSKSRKPKGPIVSKQVKEKGTAGLTKKPKKKTYSEEDLGIPKLNMITPVGVVKPKGKKKGKVFVDDREGMNTILAMVQADQNGQIESKMIKARQMEEIREARKVEAAKKEEERKARLEDKKDSLRKKRKKKSTGGDDESIKEVTAAGTKSRKRVSFV